MSEKPMCSPQKFGAVEWANCFSYVYRYRFLTFSESHYGEDLLIRPKNRNSTMQNERGHFLKDFSGAIGGWVSLQSRRVNAQTAPSPQASVERPTVRDRFWIWGWNAGALTNLYGLPGVSRITAVEGAFYLGVPNLILVALPDPKEPCKWLPEAASFEQYAISFRELKRVVWFIVGGGKMVAGPKNLEVVLQLTQKFPNIVGVIMDDFFRNTIDGGKVGTLTPRELSYIQSQLKMNGRKLDLWAVVYHHDLQYPIAEYLDEVDIVTYWTWEARNLDQLEDAFVQLEELAPRARKMLGCYMWDYGAKKPIPLNLMQKQCQLGLDWLRAGRIEGMIFLGSGSCDLRLGAVDWTRNWIREVGDGSVTF